MLSFYAVPTELKRGSPHFFYKHIVPTGLKKVQKKKEEQANPPTNVTHYLIMSYFAQLV